MQPLLARNKTVNRLCKDREKHINKNQIDKTSEFINEQKDWLNQIHFIQTSKSSQPKDVFNRLDNAVTFTENITTVYHVKWGSASFYNTNESAISQIQCLICECP